MHTSPEELAEEGILKKKKIKRVQLDGVKVNMVNVKGAPKGKVVCELLVSLGTVSEAKSSHSLRESESKDEAVLLAAEEEVSLPSFLLTKLTLTHTHTHTLKLLHTHTHTHTGVRAVGEGSGAGDRQSL